MNEAAAAAAAAAAVEEETGCWRRRRPYHIFICKALLVTTRGTIRSLLMNTSS
jgi:hypothetical protein